MKPEVAQEYIGYLRHEKQLADRTIEEYRRELCKYLEWCVGNDVVPLEATAHDTRRYQRSLSIGNLKKSSIARALSSLKTFYKWAKMDEYAEHDAGYYLTIPKKDKVLPVYLTEEQQEQLVAVLNEGKGTGAIQKKLIVYLCMYCGLRAAEVQGLTLNSVERDSLGAPVRLKVFGKGSKERMVPIPEPVREPLKKWIHHRHQLRDWNYARHFSRPEGYIKSSFLIPGLEGDKIVYRSINYAVKSACEAIGVTNITPHKLRHTYATFLTRKGVAMPIVQGLLGHESIVTTQIYTHVSQDDMEQAVLEKFDM